jgi:hypothetical protein
MAAEGEPPRTLAGLFQRLAGDLGEVTERRSRDGVEYLAGSRAFATCDGDVAEFRLRPEIAEAAERMSDTGPSTRGSGWVRLAPAVVDRFVLDRAEAWFLSAWRSAQH